MAACAREKAGPGGAGAGGRHAAAAAAGAFDLVTCLDDGLNHLTEPAEVLAAFRGMRRNLGSRRPDRLRRRAGLGLLGGGGRRGGERRALVARRGAAARLERPGATVELVVDVFSPPRRRRLGPAADRQRHRHYPVSRIVGLLEKAGLRVLTARGQRRGGVLTETLDEERDRKAFLATTRE